MMCIFLVVYIPNNNNKLNRFQMIYTMLKITLIQIPVYFKLLFKMLFILKSHSKMHINYINS